ncbi:MAG: cobalt ECF transporter T component CbiQ [Desulfobacteraceae bacterium]|nr:cobalt ECF transporter T component CbiQ [Desulfobacteraceae bacterium]
MADVIHIPLWYLPLLVLLPLVALAAAAVWLRRLAHRQSIAGEEPDWSVPPLASEKGDDSMLHRWDVRCKIVTIMIFSFVIASLSHLAPALAAVGISLIVLAISKACLARVLFRLLALAGFLGILAVVMPFTVPAHPGDTLVVFAGLDWLGLNMRGLLLAATIAARAVAIALLMEPLLSTAPLPVTLHGLSRLGVPEMASQMVLLSHRYVHVFRQEARRMSSGMQVRGFRKQTDFETLRIVANFLGMLFVRSFERTERVFEAMRARGYRGRFPEPVKLRIRPADILIAALWMAAAAALITYDRVIL